MATANKKENIDDKVIKFVEETKKKSKEIIWLYEHKKKDYRDQKSNTDLNSKSDVIKSAKKLIRLRDSFAKKHDSLILNIHKKGQEFLEKGCSDASINIIKKLIDKMIVTEESEFNIYFGGTSFYFLRGNDCVYYFPFDETLITFDDYMNDFYGDERFYDKFHISSASKDIRRWWISKYKSTPDFQRNKLKKELDNTLIKTEQSLKNAKKRRKNLDSKEEPLKKEIDDIKQSIDNAEKAFPDSKSKIEANASKELNRINSDIEKKKKEIESAEKSIKDLQAQKENAFFLRFLLKKELTQKIESTIIEKIKLTEDINTLESEHKEIENRRNQDITALQQEIDEQQKLLTSKEKELNNLPNKKTKLDNQISNLSTELSYIQNQISNLGYDICDDTDMYDVDDDDDYYGYDDDDDDCDDDYDDDCDDDCDYDYDYDDDDDDCDDIYDL
ncbi:MAG: hypothetical protein U0L18_11845 [Acutalibacteraceae bacterium]|nr:hypothetical protein [Acutalibacteraceae bacterium]